MSVYTVNVVSLTDGFSILYSVSFLSVISSNSKF